MKFKSKIVFGKEQVIKIYQGKSLSTEEIKNHVKMYQFDSLEELNAFELGIHEGLGWWSYCIPKHEFKNPQKVNGLIRD